VCVLSDLLCGFQQGKTEFGKIKVKKHNFAQQFDWFGTGF